MKAQPRADIEFEIGVMHSMQTPKARNGMKEHVLQIDREVEDDHRSHHAQPRLNRESIEEAKAARFSEESEANSCGWEKNSDQHRV
jgi:hypothetical protein